MKTNEIGIELKELGLKDQSVHRNLTVGELVDDIVANNEGLIGLRGAAMVDTGIYTGRSPKDKYIVDESSSNDKIWWGSVNQKISEDILLEAINKSQGKLNDRIMNNQEEFELLGHLTIYDEDSVKMMMQGEAQLYKDLRAKLLVQTAFVAIDPKTGGILAMI